MIHLAPVVRSKVFSYLLTAGVSLGAAYGGAILIAPSEGLVLGTYKDAVGIVTSCYGHTGPELKMGMTFTQAECDKQLAADVNKHNKEMMQYVKVPLNTYQEAALTSFSYNVGIGNFKNSTMLKYFNNKRYTEGCKQLINWVYAGGKKLPGLEIRRENEMDFCLGNVDLKAELKK